MFYLDLFCEYRKRNTLEARVSFCFVLFLQGYTQICAGCALYSHLAGFSRPKCFVLFCFCLIQTSSGDIALLWALKLRNHHWNSPVPGSRWQPLKQPLAASAEPSRFASPSPSCSLSLYPRLFEPSLRLPWSHHRVSILCSPPSSSAPCPMHFIALSLSWLLCFILLSVGNHCK